MTEALERLRVVCEAAATAGIELNEQSKFDEFYRSFSPTTVAALLDVAEAARDCLNSGTLFGAMRNTGDLECALAALENTGGRGKKVMGDSYA